MTKYTILTSRIHQNPRGDYHAERRRVSKGLKRRLRLKLDDRRKKTKQTRRLSVERTWEEIETETRRHSPLSVASRQCVLNLGQRRRKPNKRGSWICVWVESKGLIQMGLCLSCSTGRPAVRSSSAHSFYKIWVELSFEFDLYMNLFNVYSFIVRLADSWICPVH
jgi:hypothetical protein